MAGIPIPGSDLEIDLNPFDNHEPDTKAERRRKLAAKWDGRGKPPSREVAVAWLVEKGGYHSVPAAERVVGRSGTLTEVGRRVRGAAGQRSTETETWRDEWRREHPEAAAAKPGQPTPQQIKQAAAEGPDALDALLGSEVGAPTAEDTRGAPLWRYEGDPEALAKLTVRDTSSTGINQLRGPNWRGEREALRPDHPSRVGARYFEQDTLEPLKWSAEQRADLQRVLNGIGLYGKKAKIRLGNWTAKDQAVYAELLASANEEGLTWLEMLNKWKRQPPEDILAEINGSGSGEGERAPLVVQHTNPIDVQETARDVSHTLIGRDDRGFIAGTPAGYNQLETSAQTAAYNASDPEGGGGTVVDAPSPTAFAADQLRRTHGTEVDSYSTLGAFNEVLRQLGLAG